ncbi:MAG: hypothetical protein KDD10_21005 [Phaeodactylibacter sp.]|nr:hypothetical protein [Phaeodactylibacter sp.]
MAGKDRVLIVGGQECKKKGAAQGALLLFWGHFQPLMLDSATALPASRTGAVSPPGHIEHFPVRRAPNLQFVIKNSNAVLQSKGAIQAQLSIRKKQSQIIVGAIVVARSEILAGRDIAIGGVVTASPIPYRRTVLVVKISDRPACFSFHFVDVEADMNPHTFSVVLVDIVFRPNIVELEGRRMDGYLDILFAKDFSVRKGSISCGRNRNCQKQG